MNKTFARAIRDDVVLANDWSAGHRPGSSAVEFTLASGAYVEASRDGARRSEELRLP
jgi:hypothetical protein